jgi:PAS domain S-box-containing protein
MRLLSSIKKTFARTSRNDVFLHQTFDHLLEGIQIHDFNWRYIYVNNALIKYSHYPKDELLGNTLMDKYPGIENTDLFKILDRCMRNRMSEHFETEFIFPDGSKGDFELSIQPIPEGLFILSIDISERKRTQERFNANEKRFKALVENNYDIISLVDESFKVIYLSPSAARILGYTLEEMQVSRETNAVHPEDREYIASRLQEAKENPGKQVHALFRRQHKNGHYIWLEGVITNLLHDEEMKGYITNFRDITQQKEAEQKLKLSELYYRSIIEQANDMIYITDPSLTQKFIDINPSGCKMLGYTKEEFLKLKPIELVFEEDLAKNPIKLDLLKSGAVIINERRLKRKDGTAVETESTGKMSADGNFIVFARNISERKKAEKEIRALNENLEKKVVERTIELEYIIAELKESEEKFQKVFRTNAVGIAIAYTQNMHYIDANDTFIEMTGFSRKDLLGRSSLELGMVINIEGREERLKEIRETGSAKNFEMTLRHKSGKAFIILASVETIILKGQMHSLSFIYDITDRKKAEEQLALANKELEAFTYTVSHDLRAPLRAINGYAEILHEDCGPQVNEEGNRLIQNITQNAVKMGNLIDDLLAFSKLGRKEVQKQQADLNEILEEIITDMKKNLNHKAEIKFGILHKVMADYNLLYQVLFNLISNGIKYSSLVRNPVVEISSKERNGEVIVSVRDNGAGFDMKYANKLFGVFQRLHSQEEFEGTGVGLAIVQRIIEKHNGQVYAEGKINEGATFSFSLPNI